MLYIYKILHIHDIHEVTYIEAQNNIHHNINIKLFTQIKVTS